VTTKMTPARRFEIEWAQLNANHPKDCLMALVRRLDRAGATRHAMSLDRIVARLEAWQNRK
jgi:hypothetical protein